jgi:ATP-dependent RNA helicase DHX37/DHR1
VQVEVEIKSNQVGKYDDANPLILPSTKRKTKIVKDKKSNQRILSKNQRKKLEKIVDVKKKKANVIQLVDYCRHCCHELTYTLLITESRVA